MTIHPDHPLPEKFASLAHVPSVTQQTEWPCDFFYFGKWEQPGVNYFNPGLVERPDGLWLITRRSKNSHKIKMGVNDLVAFKLENRNPVLGVAVKINAMFPGQEHFEDARACYFDGITYISCCNFIIRNQLWTGAHQIVAPTNGGWQCVNRYDPVYGFNGSEIGRNTGNEKNWVWFFHDGQPHLIYFILPHTIALFDKEFKHIKTTETDTQLKWEFGQPRGGTPPVRVENEYWCFFHSSTTWKPPNPKRQYHMGAYAFEDKPPFRVTRMTTVPLLSGSRSDPFSDAKPLVVFPCGAVFKDGKWMISLGVNDLISAWIEIPHEDVVKRTSTYATAPKNIPFVSTAKTLIKTVVNGAKVYYHSGNLGDIIYALYAIKLHGGGDLLIGPEQHETAPCQTPTTRAQFEALLPLIKEVDYIRHCEFRETYPDGELTHDLNTFRNYWNDWALRQKENIHTLCKMHCHALGVLEEFNEMDKWIELDNPIVTDRIVIHRSQRYNAKTFPWKDILDVYGDSLVFVGFPEEHQEFERQIGSVPFWKMRHLLDMARVIAGARGFIGNQSFPCSLALALGQNVFQEAWEPSMDCVFERENFKTQFSGDITDIEGWLVKEAVEA